MITQALHDLTDARLCNDACRDTQHARRGELRPEARLKFLKLSIARQYVDQWSEERQEAYRCWLLLNYGLS